MTDFIKPKKDFSDLEKSKYVQKWIRNYKTDQRARLGLLDGFCDFTEKTPDELIMIHFEDTQKMPLERTHITKQYFFDWFEHLKENGVSHNAARQYVWGKIASFYAQNDVPVVMKKGETPAPQKGVTDKVWKKDGKRISKDDKIFTLRNIRDALPTLRDRAIFLCKLSSGMDDCDLFVLKVKDFEEGYFPDFNICYVEGVRIRPQGNPYFQTFFSGEACDLINMYLAHRKEKGEKITPNSDLFVSERMTADGKPKKIKASAFSEQLKKTCEQLNVQNITPKRFRSHFSTILKRGKIEHDIVERLMGHSGEVSKHYVDLFNDSEEFAEFFSENIEPIVCLGNGNAKYQKLDVEMKELKEENAQLTKKLNDLITAVYMIKNTIEKESNVHIDLSLESLGKRPIEKPKKFDKDGKEIPI